MEEQNKTLKQQSMRKEKKNELVLIDAERGIIAESWKSPIQKRKLKLILSVFFLSLITL